MREWGNIIIRIAKFAAGQSNYLHGDAPRHRYLPSGKTLLNLKWEAASAQLSLAQAVGHSWRANLGHFSRVPKDEG
jgi:hypothetical protein